MFSNMFFYCEFINKKIHELKVAYYNSMEKNHAAASFVLWTVHLGRSAEKTIFFSPRIVPLVIKGN